jgi:hypothetical protein
VPEFDNYDVVGLHGFDDFVEAAFAGEGAGTAAADGFVDDGQGERVRDEYSPACLCYVRFVRGW